MVRILGRLAFVVFAVVCLTAPGGGIKCGGGGAVPRAGAPAKPVPAPAKPAPSSSAGDKVAQVIVTGATVTGYVALAVSNVQEARAATLDVEKKQLEIEALKKDGERVTDRADLNDEQVNKIKTDKKVTVKFDDGGEKELPVTIK